ncbi:MAG: PKD domain-containing protein, partial [Deltaproteobacteria bacterium]|nr:PKD domain-containing protein [Deltaproteobacteria bacterium]
MKRIAVGVAILFVILAFAQVQAAVLWESDYYAFRYEVQPNGGLFYYPAGVAGGWVEATGVVTHSGVSAGPFSSILLKNVEPGQSISGFPTGVIQMNAMAKGPDGGINPENGTLVQGFAEINLNGFGGNYAVDVDQEVKTYIVRRFRVDSPGQYYTGAYLYGLVDFLPFGTTSSNYHALYSLGAVVTLEEWQDGSPDPTKLRDVAQISLNKFDRYESIGVELSADTGIFYQFKIDLDLGTDVQNYDYSSFQVTGPLNGPLEIGTAEKPFELGGFVSSDSNLPPIASFTGDPTSGEVPLTINFNASASDDLDGTVVSYDWNFGDGGSDSGVTAIHEYTEAGTYTVTLTVTDDDGATRTVTKTDYVTVTAPTQYTLTVTTEGQGTVTLDPAGGTYDED